MKEIIDRLNENRQVELAKDILESKGYKVTKSSRRLKESVDIPCDKVMSNSEAKKVWSDMIKNPADYGYDEYPEFLEIAKNILSILREYKGATYYSDLGPTIDYECGYELIDTGNDYLCKGTVIDPDGKEYSGYIVGNRDGMTSFLLIK